MHGPARKIERATYDALAFRCFAAGSHPDHDTLTSCRRRFLDALAGIFLQVLELAGEMKLLKLGTVSLNLPEEIKRRQDRLAAMAAAKVKIEARARVRFEQEQVAYQEPPDWSARFEDPAPLAADATPQNTWPTNSRASQAASCMPCANRRWSQCLASANRCWALVSSCCEARTRCAVNGA
jgi:hypothetical protein